MFVFYIQLPYLFNSAAESNGQNAGITDSRIAGSLEERLIDAIAATKVQTYFKFTYIYIV